MSPGPGGYSPMNQDNAAWNVIARDNLEKKGAIGSSKSKGEGDKKALGDKKKQDKPFPGPG